MGTVRPPAVGFSRFSPPLDVERHRFSYLQSRNRAAHYTVTRAAERRHACPAGAADERVEAIGAVEQAELGAAVQMNEIGAGPHAVHPSGQTAPMSLRSAGRVGSILGRRSAGG